MGFENAIPYLEFALFMLGLLFLYWIVDTILQNKKRIKKLEEQEQKKS